jgi:MFS family permease
MTLFMGILAGYLVFTHCADNFGRRVAVLLTWSTATVGLGLLWASTSIEVACVGLFLAGAGCESNIRVTLAVLSETVDYHLRQTYSLILQTAYGLAGICVSLGYYFLQNWRVVNLVFCALPALLLLVALTAYLEETPRHLARRSSRALLESLRRIASINGLECRIGEDEVIAVMNQREESRVEVGLSLFDLLRFRSLRRNTIYLSIVLFFLASLYIGPSSVIDQFEVDIFLLQIILSISDCIAYPIACYFISTTRRRRAGIKYFGLCALFTLAAHFFEPTDGCTSCLPAIIRVVLLFLSRYCVSYYYGVVFLYIVEIYP